MRVTNMHMFTENHRFSVYRDFSLSSMDYKMLSSIYQPMIGAFAISLFQSLYLQLPGEKAGFAPLEQQRKLFLSLELEPGERGRKYLIEQTSRLEAVGLLQTTRRFLPSSEEYVYEYQLFTPLSPYEFFKNQHLTLLLRDKVGKYMVLLLRDELLQEEPEEMAGAASENISVPFYELFRLNTQVFDYELEQAIFETASSRQSGPALDVTTRGFDYAEILTHFPKSSRNRPFIEALQFRKDQLAAVNITAKKYDLKLQETCRLLDEDGIFDEEGNLLYEVLQYRANLLFRQGKRRQENTDRKLQKLEVLRGSQEDQLQDEKPVEMEFYLDVPAMFQGQCDIHQYNMLLRNEPYILVLKKFFPQGSVPDGVLDIFEKIDLNYGLKEEVINVLIHFIHADRRSWAKSSIEAAASDMLGKHIATYEQAVEYIRAKMRYKARAAAKQETAGYVSKGSGRGRQKPVIPVIKDKPARKPLTEEEMDAIIRKAKKQ